MVRAGLCWLLAVTPLLCAADSSADSAAAILKEKCFQCHGAALQMSKLDLRTRESILKGGEKGPAITPGSAEKSALYRRVTGLDKPAMPLAPLAPLTPREIAVLKDWIDGGAPMTAPAPATQTNTSYGKGYQEKVFTDADRKWWAFQPPVRQPLPKVQDARWSANPLDTFVKDALDRKGLAAAPEADRATLIRRAYLDLTGLLPSPAEVDAFVKDPSPRAYSDLVDRLLASPQYGERWGRFWLDVVRYSDSSGYEHDVDIPNAWRYRDYVIKAFNQDKPYNRFVIEQLAGDELEDRDFDALVATGYYRVGPRVRYREKDNPYYRYEYLDDILRTTFQGFLGLSVNCARCHDHKFDPITRLDYYRSMAMLFGFVDYDYPLAAPDKVAEYERLQQEVANDIRPLMRQVAVLETPYLKKDFDKKLSQFPEEIQVAVRTPAEQRTPGQKLTASQFPMPNLDVDQIAAGVRYVDTSKPRIKLSDADAAERRKLLGQVAVIEKKLPHELPIGEGVRDGDYRLAPDGDGDELPGTGRFNYGVTCCYVPQAGKPYVVPPVYFGANGQDVAEDRKSFVVQPGYLKVLANASLPVTHPPANGYVTSGRRRALAEWIASPQNPLAARVMVNRIWAWHFGTGIVATPGNFGKMGIAPSNPELLDWLATEFVRQGWSIKQMHRLIMNSAAYKSASTFYRAENMEKDPTDTYLWRFPMRRLEAEAIHDIILSASGKINLQMGGLPFFPSIPKAVRETNTWGKWTLTKEEPSTWRRSVYIYWKRGLKYPLFDVFDQPDPNVTCERRNTSTVPTQALTLLNNEFVLLQAKYFAERVMKEGGGPQDWVRLVYKIALSREPEPKEMEHNLDFLRRQKEYHQGDDLAALDDLTQVMLNANEFVYVN